MLGKDIGGYHIEQFLGKGGFGEVYSASKAGTLYAIKFIRKDFIQKDLEEKMLNREIAALKKVNSPYSVKYFEDGDHTEGFIEYKYIVMELAEGETLRESLAKNPAPRDEKTALALGVKILKGLKDIHAADIIHRDLKPENIKILPSGDIKILDYGLSKIIDYTSIAQTGQPVGTFYYMSPQQAKGEKPIEKGSDFYSVGVMLYELLTGQILFYPSSVAEIVYKTVHVKPPYPSTINPKISNNIEDTILKLLEKETFKRHKEIDEIIADLEQAPASRPVQLPDHASFFPRLIQNDTEVIKTYLAKNDIDGADFPINLHAQYKEITKALTAVAGKMKFFADPSTNRLAFSSFRKTKGLKALPYAPTGYDPLDTDNFADVSAIKLFVEQVIDLQVGNGCSVLTAPFFYFDNTGDDWYGVNLKLLRESIAYVSSKYSQYPISGAICTQAELLCRKKEREKIINDFGNCDVDYLQLYADKISETTVDAQIYNYILTGTSIGKFNKAKIIACRVPAVALGLLTVGFHAINSGLAVLESFDKGVITKEDDMARMPTRFYFPNLLKTVVLSPKSQVYEDILSQEAALKKEMPHIDFDFTCSCAGCQHRTLSANFQKPRLHFLYARAKEISELNALTGAERKAYFNERIDNAYALQRKLIEAGIKLDTPEYLQTWKEVLRQF